MTLSTSELFCKNFDPYYAAATGFHGEITLWMAVALVILFLEVSSLNCSGVNMFVLWRRIK